MKSLLMTKSSVLFGLKVVDQAIYTVKNWTSVAKTEERIQPVPPFYLIVKDLSFVGHWENIQSALGLRLSHQENTFTEIVLPEWEKIE